MKQTKYQYASESPLPFDMPLRFSTQKIEAQHSKMCLLYGLIHAASFVGCTSLWVWIPQRSCDKCTWNCRIENCRGMIRNNILAPWDFPFIGQARICETLSFLFCSELMKRGLRVAKLCFAHAPMIVWTVFSTVNSQTWRENLPPTYRCASWLAQLVPISHTLFLKASTTTNLRNIWKRRQSALWSALFKIPLIICNKDSTRKGTKGQIKRSKWVASRKEAEEAAGHLRLSWEQGLRCELRLPEDFLQTA